MSELNLRRLLIKNTGVQMVAQAVSLVMSFVTSYVLSRHLGTEGFGHFNYIFAFFYFFQTLNDFGINTIVVREVSKHRDRANEIIGAILSFKLILAAVSTLGSWITIWLMDFNQEMKTSLFVFSAILPIIALQLPSVIFQIALKVEYPSVIGIINRCLGFALLMCAAWAKSGLVAIVTSQIIAEVCGLSLLLHFARRFVRPVWHIDWLLWKTILSSSIPLGAAMVFTALINRIDFLMLERMTDFNQVGLYAACYKVTNVLESLPLMIMGTIYPLMSRYAQEDWAKLRSLYNKTTFYLGLIALPLGILATFFAPFIIRILFGEKFVGAESGLRILIWSTVFLYMALSGGNLLVSVGKEKINLLLNIAGAVLNIALNFLLIPSKGFIGAALATSATYLFILLSISICSLNALRIPPSRAIGTVERFSN